MLREAGHVPVVRSIVSPPDLTALTWLRTRMGATAIERVALEEQTGALLRGALGHVLRGMVCTTGAADCASSSRPSMMQAGLRNTLF